MLLLWQLRIGLSMNNSLNSTLDTHQKALSINMDSAKYGTLAEIGGGQEVARWFFRVGGASGTVAKTMSAYDMAFSDAIYGACQRYVSRQRVSTMLSHEYGLLEERLAPQRGHVSRFFAFADTVRTRSFSGKQNGQGWVGIRFQHEVGAPASQILIHVQLWGKESIEDQETLGVLGINLIYGAYHLHEQPEALVASLADHLPQNRLEIDMVEFTGPAFRGVDNRLMCLRLVERGLANAAIFDAQGAMIEPSELFHKKPVLLQRGHFRPVTRLTVDMLERAVSQFVQEPNVDPGDLVIVQEMSLQHLRHAGQKKDIDAQDFLDRVDCLSALGYPVVLSNYDVFHRLAAYLFRQTSQPIALCFGVPTLLELFKEHYYQDLDGGILEAFGRLFKHELKCYTYPWKDPLSGALITAGNLRVEPHLRHLYQYLHENHFIQPIRDYDPSCLPLQAAAILKRLQEEEPGWEKEVPAPVASLIRERGLFQRPLNRS